MYTRISNSSFSRGLRAPPRCIYFRLLHHVARKVGKWRRYKFYLFFNFLNNFPGINSARVGLNALLAIFFGKQGLSNALGWMRFGNGMGNVIWSFFIRKITDEALIIPFWISVIFMGVGVIFSFFLVIWGGKRLKMFDGKKEKTIKMTEVCNICSFFYFSNSLVTTLFLCERCECCSESMVSGDSEC